MFFWNSFAFSMTQRMLAIWSLVSLPFLNPAWTSGSSRFHILLKPILGNFEHYFASTWDECNCTVVWTVFGIAFLWNRMKTDLFLSAMLMSYGHCWICQICWCIISCSLWPIFRARILEWVKWLFPSPEGLPNPGIEPRSPSLQADSLPAEPQGKPLDI